MAAAFITSEEAAAILAVSRPRAQALLAGCELVDGHRRNLYRLERVRQMAAARRQHAEARARQLEAEGYIFAETMAAALGCPVETLASLPTVTAGAGLRLIHRDELDRARAIISSHTPKEI